MLLPYTRRRSPAFIITFHARFRADAIEELRNRSPLATLRQIDAGLAFVEQPDTDTGPQLDERFLADRPVFIEHIAPVAVTVSLRGERDDLSGLAEIVAAENDWRSFASVAVECRKAAGSVSGTHASALYTCRDVEVATGTAVEAAGATIDLDQSDGVIHVVLEQDVAHIGTAPSTATLRRRGDPLTRAPGPQVTRAEHKLAEALTAFGVTIRTDSRVLDLGAAPGGWSLLLADQGAHVTAVDPAALHARVVSHPRVTHVKARAEQVASAWPKDSFDLVVNDMALDPDDSAAVMRAVASAAPVGANGVMTVKLPTRNVKRWIHAAEEALAGTWQVIAARHLAANRQELTWHLRRSAADQPRL